MFEPLFHAEMSVFDQFFFAEYTCQLIEEELQAKNRIIEVENIPKKRSFLKSFLRRASLKSGIPEMGQSKSGIPEMGQP